MAKILLNVVMNLLATVTQVATALPAAAINAAFPDLTDKIHDTTSTIVSFVQSLAWVIDILPVSFKIVLAFIITLEIAKLTVFRSTENLLRLYNLFQKLKFW